MKTKIKIEKLNNLNHQNPFFYLLIFSYNYKSYSLSFSITFLKFSTAFVKISSFLFYSSFSY